MSLLQTLAICLTVTAALAYLNARYVRLPTTIGVMSGALLLSLGLVALDQLGFGDLREFEDPFLRSIDFSNLLMQGMLSILLVAGALHVDLSLLRDYRIQVGMLAVFGTLATTVLVAAATWWLAPLVGVSLPFGYCLVFGALIAPTDPIAVMGILRSSGAPESVRLVVSGESLFNDGVGVVLFTLLLGVALTGQAPTMAEAATALAHEAGGGLVLGLAIGLLLFFLLRSINNYKVEVLLTLAGVIGGYEFARFLHVSGPLAMVVAGLVVGNHGRALAMSDTTRHHVDLFWALLDDILNAVLFVLLGLEIVLVGFSRSMLFAALGAIVVVVLVRALAVGLPVALFRRWFRLPQGAWKVLTWGGLRGGISVALALSLPLGPERDTILSLTYAIVVFSILVQGLTIGHAVPRAPAEPGVAEPVPD